VPAGSATAADVPGRYDVVINGFGYCFADSVEPSLPFRTHRAIYDISPTFVERQNVSQAYGDQTQDFFLTSTQNDWSLGEDQKFFHLSDKDSVRRYWAGTNVDITVPGQVTIRPGQVTKTFAAAVSGCGYDGAVSVHTASSTNVYQIDNTGTITDRGAHGAGGLPEMLASDGLFLYLCGSAVTSTRKYDSIAHTYAAFSATALEWGAYTSNTLFGTKSGLLKQLDTAGASTTLFTWKGADGTTIANARRIVRAGGTLYVLSPANESPDGATYLSLYAGTAPVQVAEFPSSFQPSGMCEANGLIYIIGHETNGALGVRTVIYYLANGTLGRLYAAQGWYTGNHAGLDICNYLGGLVFPDLTSSTLRYYDLAAGGVSTIGSITPTNSDIHMSASKNALLVTQNAVDTIFFASNAATASTATVTSSLMDFDNSLAKMFRGIKVDWQAASDGDGGSVDIAYQVDSVSGSYTNLQTSAVSGTEYLATSVSGHAISVKITLNKGTSTAGPILKRVYVRAAPQLQQFNSGLYIFDCTASQAQPRELRDGTYSPLTGYEMVENLRTAAKSTTPFSITDKVNGTYNGLVDLQAQDGWDVYEIHPDPDNPSKPGSYFVRVKVREV
jgi:hypothetical protein